ncbi:MAG: TRAP transporter large permease subunit, partial [Oscillospiraceae bacterium]|nr:TRAP transporter large permease subunit [Oscillospiraceae bacterium]
FGVIMVANASIGMFTPPFGLNLFVAGPVTGNDMKTIMKGVMPFVAISILALLLITYVEPISMILPNLIY